MPTKDLYPYAVFTLDRDGWREAIWTGDANGHDDALDLAQIVPPMDGHTRVMTVCMPDDGPPIMREYKISRNVETVA